MPRLRRRQDNPTGRYRRIFEEFRHRNNICMRSRFKCICGYKDYDYIRNDINFDSRCEFIRNEKYKYGFKFFIVDRRNSNTTNQPQLRAVRPRRNVVINPSFRANITVT